MKQWQYKHQRIQYDNPGYEDYDTPDPYECFLKKLNELGQEGWELVSMTYKFYNRYMVWSCYFKREMTGSPYRG